MGVRVESPFVEVNVSCPHHLVCPHPPAHCFDEGTERGLNIPKLEPLLVLEMESLGGSLFLSFLVGAEFLAFVLPILSVLYQ